MVLKRCGEYLQYARKMDGREKAYKRKMFSNNKVPLKCL